MRKQDEQTPTADAGPVERVVRPGAEAPTLVERLRTRPTGDPYLHMMVHEAADEIDRLNAQRRELQAERERLLDRLARAGLEASRMVRKERHEIAQWLDGQGQPGCAHDVRCRA